MTKTAVLIIVIVVVIVLVLIARFVRHQRLLKDRAHLMREAMRNHDFTFRLPCKGLFSGERALQEALNDLGADINRLVAQNEVESWQRLTRVLTHEIMNATTPISTITQAYMNSPKIKGTPYETGIRTIHDTCAGLTSFVDSYRKLTQLQEPVPTDVCLAEFMQGIQNLYAQLHWHTDLPHTLMVHTDENLLRQVLINLVKNAVEAGAQQIDLRWSDALLISNDGSPIPADVQREIFIPFFTTKQTGSGIGLSLSRQIMMRQGGELSLADHPVSGFHTTFILHF